MANRSLSPTWVTLCLERPSGCLGVQEVEGGNLKLRL